MNTFCAHISSVKIIRQRGIALLQVLLISSIISILALFFTLTARQQLSVATLANDRVNAELLVRTAESKVMFELMTKESATSELYPMPKGYNFYANPISIDEYTKVEIQDVAGLLSVQYPDHTLLTKTLERLGASSDIAVQFTDSLADWQDADDLKRLNGAEKGDYPLGPRNATISLKSEAALVKGMTPLLWKQVSPLLTVPRANYFNPMVAPSPILKAFLNSDAQDILRLREEGRLTRSEFSQLTGVYDQEGIILSKSDIFRVKIKVHYGAVELTKTATLKLDPYALEDRSVIDGVNSKW
ncbi:general secretion pathway protein GspK [Shewanella halifaxensis]|uniref:general secretion pathway protein GspK n=1 Tax=Shewanella halifaxensis TaxID=271098 RepID=UPI000D596408|nr:type II secretion system protein GspK [Shewanella halifaxensis]